MDTTTYRQIIDYLRELIIGSPWEGHIYAVGGCCRDLLMEREINDIDLAVDTPDGGVKFALWLDKQGLTEYHPTLFERYGTARLRLSRFPDYEIEMVQTRRAKYGADTDKEGAEAVYGSIEDDAMRRDLTINSLFYDITNDRMLDITGRAMADIAEKRLATPMDAAETFEDDPVRMLRVVRMAASFGWKLPKELATVINANAKLLAKVHVERSRAEFEKMITGPKPHEAMRMMRRTGLLHALLPDVQRLTFRSIDRKLTAEGSDSVWKRLVKVLKQAAPIDKVEIAWALILTQLYWEEEIHRAATAKNSKDNKKKDNPEQRAGARGRRHKPFRELPVYERVLRKVHHHSKFVNAVGMLVENARLAERLAEGGKLSPKRRKRLIRNICVNADRCEMLLTFMKYIPTFDNKITPEMTDHAINAIAESETMRANIKPTTDITDHACNTEH